MTRARQTQMNVRTPLCWMSPDQAVDSKGKATCKYETGAVARKSKRPAKLLSSPDRARRRDETATAEAEKGAAAVSTQKAATGSNSADETRRSGRHRTNMGETEQGVEYRMSSSTRPTLASMHTRRPPIVGPSSRQLAARLRPRPRT